MFNRHVTRRAAEYPHYIAIERLSAPKTQDESGEELSADGYWETVTEVWAKIEPVSGRDYFQNLQVQSALTHKVELRSFVDGVTPRDRVSFGDRKFNIAAVINQEERGRQLELMCSEQQ